MLKKALLPEKKKEKYAILKVMWEIDKIQNFQRHFRIVLNPEFSQKG